MGEIVIDAQNISKLYRLGVVGAGSLLSDAKIVLSKLKGEYNPAEFATKGEVGNTKWALRGVDFRVERGDILGIVGNNGAGKSTLLKILSKITGPTTGQIKIKGRIASLLEVGTGFHPELTGRENIYLNGHILGMNKGEITQKFDEIVDFAKVEHYLDTPVKRYSSGMYVKLAFAVAAHLDPDILVVDEVLAVGDVEFQRKAIGKMQEVSRSGERTVLFVSHNMGSVQNLCTKGLFLQGGEVAFSGTAKDTVDAYISDTVNFNTSTYIEIPSTNTAQFQVKELEIKAVEFLEIQENNQFSTNDTILVQLTVFAHQSVNEFRPGFEIYNFQEQIVGKHFSATYFSLSKGQSCKVKMRIAKHQLAKGQYYFNFSVGTGSELIGVNEYDIVEKTLFFEIAFSDEKHTNRIALWNTSNWGYINFQDVLAEKG